MKKLYKTTARSFHNGVLLPAGSLVELEDDMVAAHHELVPGPEPARDEGGRYMREPPPPPGPPEGYVALPPLEDDEG